MTFDPDFLTMWSETVLVAPYTGHDLANQSTYGADVPYQCRVSGKIVTVRKAESEQTTKTFDVWVYAPGVKITPRDRLTLPVLPEFSLDELPVIFQVAVVSDEDGYHHHKIQMGWMYHRQSAN